MEDQILTSQSTWVYETTRPQKGSRDASVHHLATDFQIARVPVQGSEDPDLIELSSARLYSRPAEDRAIVSNEIDYAPVKDLAFSIG